MRFPSDVGTAIVIESSPIEGKSLQARVLSGSFVLLVGSGFATAINFIYNIAVARFLGPTDFGNASAVYTLLILVSAVTLSFQIVSAKVVARQGSPQERSNAYHEFHSSSWACGLIMGLLFLLFRNTITEYLRLQDPKLVVLLGAGVAFYIPLGSRRGYLQGTCGFRGLAKNLVLEGFVRLCGSLLAIGLGYGVEGVIAANAAAVATAYLFARPRLPNASGSRIVIPYAFREAMQAIVFFVGQVVINNCDIVVVKHFFPPNPAGLYAAVALVGRVVFAFSWAIVNTMFPIVASAPKQEQESHKVLGMSLLLVLGIGAILSLGLRTAPGWIWTALFGNQFATTGKYGLPYLLSLYAATTCVYSLSVVMIAYEMSHKIANTSWVQLMFSIALIASIYRYHRSLQQVILVQLVMMSVLLVIVAIPFLTDWLRRRKPYHVASDAGELPWLRGATEDEVIGEFLHTDFQNPEFENYRRSLARVVDTPNYGDAGENATRLALFYLRHGSLWREIPTDTQWFETELEIGHFGRIRVFPRAQWRKLARGDYSLPRILKSIQSGEATKAADSAFLKKIENLQEAGLHMKDRGAIILIGTSRSGPWTVLDGNHRLVATILSSPSSVDRFRCFCGVSPRMIYCCWYKTNLSTLIRYARNLVRYCLHDPEKDLRRLLLADAEQLVGLSDHGIQ
jgi:O-antigen/teichoic acid export membrane protein